MNLFPGLPDLHNCSMPAKSELASLSIQSPATTPQIVRISPSLCGDLSSFKELLKEYRRLDDTVTMRLNRTQAQFRDRDRLGTLAKGDVQDQACAYFWKELVENWQRRSKIIEYCVGVVDQSMDEKKQIISETSDPALQRKLQGAVYAEEVKARQVRNERYVDALVRKRAIEAFRTRCRYFQPPFTDAEARRYWDEAQSAL